MTRDEILQRLREQEAALRALGVTHAALFGARARGDARVDSDVDLAMSFDPAARIDLIRLVGLERHLGALLGLPVQILPEPIEQPRLRARVERDGVPVF